MRFLGVSVILLLLCSFALGAENPLSFCAENDVSVAVAHAEVVFSGRVLAVTKTESPLGYFSVGPEYQVRFEVDTWWKGKAPSEVTVLWRPHILNCNYLPVGDVGQRYLVYADPSNQASYNPLLEVTALNRTSRLPDSSESGRFLGEIGSAKESFVNENPALNRTDGSNDIRSLQLLKACNCLSNVSTGASVNKSIPESLCSRCLLQSKKMP